MSKRQNKSKKAPQQERGKKRVEAIYQATKSLLEDTPLDKITTTTIAEKAVIPVGSIYQYFDDKEGIYQHLYEEAYSEVEDKIRERLQSLNPTNDFSKTVHTLVSLFWETARNHPTFRALTRWSNTERSIWEATPREDSSIAIIIKGVLELSGKSVPEEKEAIVLRTSVTVISVLIDLAIDEDDEIVSEAIIEELATIISKYFE